MKKQYEKNNVKIQLWRFGRSVKDMIGIPGVEYDLLVDGKIKICIGSDRVLCKKNCDIFACEIDGKIRYAKNRKVLKWQTPTKTFGKKIDNGLGKP